MEETPEENTLVKIKEAFPQVNMNWLVSGKGEILDEVLDEEEMLGMKWLESTKDEQRTIDTYMDTKTVS